MVESGGLCVYPAVRVVDDVGSKLVKENRLQDLPRCVRLQVEYMHMALVGVRDLSQHKCLNPART